MTLVGCQSDSILSTLGEPCVQSTWATCIGKCTLDASGVRAEDKIPGDVFSAEKNVFSVEKKILSAEKIFFV